MYFGILQHIVCLFSFPFRLDSLKQIFTTFQSASRAKHAKYFIAADLKVISRKFCKRFVTHTSHAYEESVEIIPYKPYCSPVIRFQQSINCLEHPVTSFGTRATEQRILICRGEKPSDAVWKFLDLSCGGELLSRCCCR